MDPLTKGPGFNTNPEVSKPVSPNKQIALPIEKLLAPPEPTDLSLKDRRITKTPTLSEVDQKEVAKRDGHLWTCTGRRPNEKAGKEGYIYTYKLRPEFDNFSLEHTIKELRETLDKVEIPEEIEKLKDEILTLEHEAGFRKGLGQKKIDEIFPAIEIMPGDLEDLSKSDSMQDLECLGYKITLEKDNITLEFPDEKALESNWEHFRKSEGRNLPPLRILVSEGIADDLSFVQAHTEYDILLSNESEFFHDHVSHAWSTILAILGSPTPVEDRAKMKSAFLTAYNTFQTGEMYMRLLVKSSPELIETAHKIEEQLAVVKAGLGSFVDVTTSAPHLYKPIQEYMNELMLVPKWEKYLVDRFGEKTMAENYMPRIWQDISVLSEIWHKAIVEGLRLEKTDGGLSVYQKNPEGGNPNLFVITGINERMCWLEYSPRLEITECNDVENQSHLIDLACQYAFKHQFNEVAVSNPDLNWETYFKLGFRPENILEGDEKPDMMLISTAVSLNLLTDEELEFFNKLNQVEPGENGVPESILDDQEFMDNVIYVPIDETGEFHVPVFATKDHPEINRKQLGNMKLPNEVFEDWKQISQKAQAKDGSPIKEAGLRQLHKDLENLRQRMRFLDKKIFSSPEPPPSDASNCQIL